MQVKQTRTLSAFLEKGVLSPEEFILAGDYLVSERSYWGWKWGDPKKMKPSFPADKQFLACRNVPCFRRCVVLDDAKAGEGWLAMHGKGNTGMDSGDDLDDSLIGVYDISIIYDEYYQTPHVWLEKLDLLGEPWEPELVFEDISQDSAQISVTIEYHPHKGDLCVSVHPCIYADGMKKIRCLEELNLQLKSTLSYFKSSWLLSYLPLSLMMIRTLNWEVQAAKSPMEGMAIANSNIFA